jgi:excisionase family DNA binding protein
MPVTLAQAARILGVSANTLRKQVQRGRLFATLIGKTYVVKSIEISRYRAQSAGRRGRPAGMAPGFEQLAFKAHLTGREPPCLRCAQFRGRLYSWNDPDAPDLPVVGCSKADGCTCEYD